MSDPAGVAFPMYFMKVPEPAAAKNRWHVDLVTPGDMSDEVDRLVELGARLVEVRQDPARWTIRIRGPCWRTQRETSSASPADTTRTGWPTSRHERFMMLERGRRQSHRDVETLSDRLPSGGTVA